MLVNIETNLSLKEIERLLSEKVCYEYPFFHHDYDLGINWVNNTKDLVCFTKMEQKIDGDIKLQLNYFFMER